jgi:hypothetical protein
MGKINRVIWIPKKYHDDILKLEDKQGRILIDDEIFVVVNDSPISPDEAIKIGKTVGRMIGYRGSPRK